MIRQVFKTVLFPCRISSRKKGGILEEILHDLHQESQEMVKKWTFSAKVDYGDTEHYFSGRAVL
jgi:hypothetical protein